MDPIHAIFVLTAFMIGLVVAAIVIAIMYKAKGEPSASPLIAAGRAIPPLWNMGGGLFFVLFALGLVQQSFVRGTHWYHFRIDYRGHFTLEVAMIAALGFRSIQTSFRDLRQKKSRDVDSQPDQ